MPKRLALIVLLLVVASACGPRFDVAGIESASSVVETIDATAAPTAAASARAGTVGSTRTVRRVLKGSAGSVVRGDVIKVGGLFPLSGGLSAMGVAAWQGAEAYFRWLNDHGGIEGKRIDFIECDDRADDTRSTTCAKKLIESDGAFMMGPSFTPFSFTVIKQLEDAGIPWAGYDGINVEGFDASNVVTVGAPIETMAHVLLPYWYRKLERTTGSAPKRIGAVTLDVAPAVTYVREAKNVICPKLGCTIVRDQRVNYTTLDYATICRNMQSQRVDAVWVITDPASAIKLLVQCQNIGYRPPKGFLGQHGIYMDLTLKQAGPFADGTMANGAVLPEAVDSEATRTMKQIVRTYYPDASFGYWTALSFASARMVEDLVRRVLSSGQTLTRDALLAAARGLGSYACHGMCKGVSLAPPARQSGGNHNIWIVRADFSGGAGRWAYEAGPIDAFRSETWPCPGRPC